MLLGAPRAAGRVRLLGCARSLRRGLRRGRRCVRRVGWWLLVIVCRVGAAAMGCLRVGYISAVGCRLGSS